MCSNMHSACCFKSNTNSGTQVGGMAQHQTNEIGPHGLTYTEKLMNYEKVGGWNARVAHLLTVAGKLRHPDPVFDLFGIQ